MNRRQIAFSLLALSVSMAARAAGPAIVEIADKSGKTVGALYTGTLETQDEFLKKNDLAPRGSAALTGAGALEATGIRYIIHAAPGGMVTQENSAAPSVRGVTDSIANSIRVAERFGVQRLAIPLVGGGIFLGALGISKDDLAEKIVETAHAAEPRIEIVFVAFGDEDAAVLRKAYKKVKKTHDGLVTRVKSTLKNKAIPARDEFFRRSEVVSGSITDFKVHKADAIVNAANMELRFGGGLSGVIGGATGQAAAIDAVGHELILKLHGKAAKP